MQLPEGLTPDDLHTGRAGYIHSIEHGSAVDGPGLRSTVFLTGCMLRCQYCHNPDTWHMKDGTLRTAQSVMDEIQPYIPFMQTHKGGLTLSGGEPLAQPNLTHTLLMAAQDMGLHTALDTSGFLGANASDALLEAVDLVLLDLKSGLPETYKATTHAELAPTLAFANRLKRLQKPVWVRFVLVPGLTDAPENIEAMCHILNTLENVEKVEVLPFHNMGQHKWKTLNIPYTLADTPAPPPAHTAAISQRLNAALHVNS